MRCVHLSRAGDQCRGEALATSQFCAYHSRLLEGNEFEDAPEDSSSGQIENSPRLPLAYRVAAFILLWILLYQTFGSMAAWLDW